MGTAKPVEVLQIYMRYTLSCIFIQIVTISGAKNDKSELFEYELGENGTPVIKAANLTLECTVADIYKTPNFESFICTIDNTCVEENCLNDKGKPDYTKVRPVLFEFPNYQYLRTGDVIGKCLSFKDNT